MKTLKKLPILAGILTFVLALPVASLYAQQRGQGGFDRPGFMAGRADDGIMDGAMGSMRLVRMAELLDLSKDQRNSIAKIIDNTQPKMRDNMFKLMDSRKLMRDLLNSKGKIDDKKLRSLTREQADSMAELMYLRLRMHNDIRNVLTDEQLAKLESFRGQGKKMRSDRLRDRRDRREQFRNWRQRQQPPARGDSQQG